MNRAAREQLIERYLRGQMGPSEEHDFFIEVAADRELRLDLKAYRIVDDALLKDRKADMATYSALRTNVLRMVDAHRMGEVGTDAGRSGAGAGPSTGPSTAGAIAETATKTALPGAGVLGTIGLALLAVGAALFPLLMRQPEPAPPPRSAAPPAVAPATAPDAPAWPDAARIDSSSPAELHTQGDTAPANRLGAPPKSGRSADTARAEESSRRIPRADRVDPKKDSLKFEFIIQDPKKQ